MNILKIALKNITRHKGKNILVGIMIFLAAFIFLFTSAIVKKSFLSWRDFFGTTTMGYINIGTREGMKKDVISPPVEIPGKLISDNDIEKLGIKGMNYTKRIRAGGIKYNFIEQKFDGGHNAVNIIGTNVEKELEYLKNLKIIEGKYEKETENGALVWKKMMKKYNWKIGDEISFFMLDSEEQMMPYSFIITGVIENSSGDNMESVEEHIVINPVIFVNYDYLSSMLQLQEKYTEISIWERDENKIFKIKENTLKSGYEFYYSDEAYGVIQGIVEFTRFMGYFIGIFIVIVTGIAMFNINIMGFMERRKEIGTMIAIGAKPSWIIKLMSFEMLFFGVTALAVSFILYGSFKIIFNSGVDFGPLGLLFSGQKFEFLITGEAIITTIIVVAGSMIVSTIYPLYLAKRLNPVEVFKEGEI